MQNEVGLGAFLRGRREAKGLPLEDLSRATRIVPRVLRALEQDRWEALPAPIFVRGFIRAYCAEVGEPPEAALALYDGHVRAAPARAGAGPIVPPASVDGLVRRAGPVARPGFVLAAVLLAVGGTLFYLLAPSAGTSPPGAAPKLVPASRPTPPADEPAPAPPAAAVPSTPAPEPRVLVVRAHEATWVRVRPDDGPASEALLQPGNAREWRSGGRFTVTLGNAGGVTLELDGARLPPLGVAGQVVRDVSVPGGGSP